MFFLDVCSGIHEFFAYLSVPMTVLFQEVLWNLKSLLLRMRTKVMSRRNQVQMILNIGSTYVARKLSEYLQLNHIACAGQFGEVTSIFLCIILCSRYCVPYHCPDFSLYLTRLPFLQTSLGIHFLICGGILVMYCQSGSLVCFRFSLRLLNSLIQTFLRKCVSRFMLKKSYKYGLNWRTVDWVVQNLVVSNFIFILSPFILFQVIDDIHAIWEWVLIEKLHIPRSERHMYSAVLVLSETFDSRGK